MLGSVGQRRSANPEDRRRGPASSRPRPISTAPPPPSPPPPPCCADLLWAGLTGREHLLFYGRLKNLRGAELSAAVEEGLRSVNLSAGGVGDKQVRKFSGE